MFRIVQEGLANVRKHAGAGTPRSRSSSATAAVSCVVSDDGTGFETDDPGAGQGLKNMRSRAASIEGVFRCARRPGKGTSIEVVLRPA